MSTPTQANGQFHNPGYEHLKAIYRLKEAQAKYPLQAASMYILPLLALQNASLAIEEYVNLTGRKIDPAWDKTDWTDIPVEMRIKSIYEKMGLSFSFQKNIWKEVLLLREAASFINVDLSEIKDAREDVPEKLKQIAVDYPIYRSQAVAEEAVDLLLSQSDYVNSYKRNSTLAE